MTLRRFHTLVLIVGFGLMVYLVWSVGPENILDKLRFLGWGLIILLCSEGLAEFFHAISWRYCLGNSYRSLSLARLFGMGMAGYAISYLTPTASLGGDITKTAFLAESGKGAEAISAMLISKLSFAIAHLFFVLLGCLLIVPRIAMAPAVRSALLTGCLLLTLGILAFLWIQLRGNFGTVVRWLECLKPGGRGMERLATSIGEVDFALKAFYRQRPWDLPWAVFWHALGYMVGIFQVWYFLYLVVGSPPIVPSIKVWFVGMWVDLLTFAVPMNLGTLEGGRIVAFKAVGFDPSVGMAYAVAIRMVQLSSSMLGLVGYLLLVAKRNPGKGTSLPRALRRSKLPGSS